jgi:hypothetical protein
MYICVLSNPLNLFDYKKDIIVGLTLDTVKKKALKRVSEFCSGELRIESYGTFMVEFAVCGPREEDYFDFTIYCIGERPEGMNEPARGALFVYGPELNSYPDFNRVQSEWVSEQEEIREMFGTIFNLPSEVITLVQQNNYEWLVKVDITSLKIEAKFHTLPISYFKEEAVLV